MFTVLLPLGVNTTAVNKYHIISYHIISYIIIYIISYHIYHIIYKIIYHIPGQSTCHCFQCFIYISANSSNLCCYHPSTFWKLFWTSQQALKSLEKILVGWHYRVLKSQAFKGYKNTVLGVPQKKGRILGDIHSFVFWLGQHVFWEL